MANKIVIKRTTTSGLLPNVSNSSNTSYIAAGELAINLTDRKLLSSNGSATFEIGANLASIVVGTAFTQTSGNANFDSGVLFVDGTNNRVGVNNTTPAHALSVTGTLASGNTTITGFANVSSTLAAGNTTITGFANVSTTATIGTGFTLTSGNANFDSGVLFVDGTNNRVGINTATPTSALDANGNIRTSGGSGGTITAFDNNSSRNNRAILGADANGAYLDSTYTSAGTGTITFRTIGTERVRISEAGNVLIGTTNLSAKLSVSGISLTGTTVSSTNASLFLLEPSTSSGAGGVLAFGSFYSGTSSITGASISSAKGPGEGSGSNQYDHDLIFKTSSYPSGVVEKVRITNTGNVGIGTSSPSQKLTVYNGSSRTIARIASDLNFAGAYLGTLTTENRGASLELLSHADSVNSLGWRTAVSPDVYSTNDMVFSYAGASTTYAGLSYFEKMRINTNGNLSVVGTMDATSFRDYNNTAYYLDPANTGTSMVVAGNVGIGTTSPTPYASGDRVLQINASTVADIKLTNGTTGSGASDGMLIRQDGLTSVLWNCEAGDFRFGTSNQERVRIDSEGNLLVGVTSSAYTSSGRGVIEVGGTSQALYGFRTGGVARGYFLHDGTIFRIENSVVGGQLNVNTAGSLALTTTSAHPMLFNTNSAERMRIDSAGNVGIGTTSPSARLHTQIGGAGQATPSALFFSNNDGFTPQSLIGLAIYNNRTSGFLDTNLVYGNSVNSYFAIGHHNGTSYSERMRVTSAGNVAIGDTVADWKLTVTNIGAASSIAARSNGNVAMIMAVDTSGAGYLTTNNAQPMLFSTNNTERARITNTGNVGIGTSSPNARLHVVGNAIIGQVSNSSTAARLDITAGGSGFDSIIDFGYYDSFDAAIWLVKRHGADGSFRIANAGSGSEVPVITITAGNNVGIGTTTPGYKLEVNGAFAATTKSFVINHPTKPDMKLRYGSLEGPENGVYVRGRTKGNTIQLPDYWTGLVDEFSITVNLTPIGGYQKLYVKSIDKNVVTIGGGLFDQMEYFYTVFAERKDVDKLIVEI